MTIVSLLNQIASKEIVLPAIQRDFVWSEEKIQKLMDSVLRGYPIGIVLMWETHNNIQYRKFNKDVDLSERSQFLENRQCLKRKVVLDGQQRLQSLYVALYGTLRRKFLYFDILSGRKSDDFEEDKYLFFFKTSGEAESLNTKMKDFLAHKGNAEEAKYLIRVSDLFSMTVSKKQQLRLDIKQELSLNEEGVLRLETNIWKLDEVLTKDHNILKASIIDEDKPPTSPERQTESDVLEIFVRINRQGMPLSRSDLIFSMLKLNWNESATALPDFVEKINQGNSFELDIDFVIRSLYAVSDLGTRFDIDLLRRRSNMDRMRSSFDLCCEAIQSTVDNVQEYCWLSSSKALGGNANLVPFVYYLSRCPKQQLPNKEVEKFRKAIFLLGFSSPFSRYADSRLGAFIRQELSQRLKEGNYAFPLDKMISWVSYWENVDNWGEDLVQRNARLALHIVQRTTGAKTHLAMNAREMDHIFPRSELRRKGREEWEINHFANFWLLPKGKNINKRNRHPKEYLGEIADAELRRALIEREHLDYRRYKTFLQSRGAAIIEKLEHQIKISDADFEFLKEDD